LPIAEEGDVIQFLLFQVENGVITSTRVELLRLPQAGGSDVDDA
jgi:hypothetical protein